MTTTPNLLIFDFDGVIVNSVDEVAITSYNTATGQSIYKLENLPPGYLDFFRRNRFHLQAASDFPVFAKWCAENSIPHPTQVLSIAQFQNIVRPYSSAENTNNLQMFFESRNQFISNHYKDWIALHKLYQPLGDFLKEQTRTALILLTNKNRESVIELCSHFGIKICESQIYSGDAGKSKTENLKNIRERFQLPCCAFIDDSVKNLTDLRKTNSQSELRLYLAEWGYTGPEDRDIAVSQNFNCPSQAELISEITNGHLVMRQSEE